MRELASLPRQRLPSFNFRLLSPARDSEKSSRRIYFMATANDLRRGMAINYNGDVSVVLDMQHRTPGNLRAFVQATLRSLKTGKTSNVRFASTETIAVVNMSTRRLDFSYKDANGYHFMDPETYEQTTLNEEFVGDASRYLTENLAVQLMEVEGK